MVKRSPRFPKAETSGGIPYEIDGHVVSRREYVAHQAEQKRTAALSELNEAAAESGPKSKTPQKTPTALEAAAASRSNRP